MIEQFISDITPTMEHFQTLGYWIAFFAAFLETAFLVGLFIPGSTVLLLLGAYSVGGHLDWGYLLFFAILGAILGDNLNYWLGKRYGHRWVANGAGFITPQHFAKSEQFFQAHGGKSVFLGRFIPSIKELIPFVAGTMQMPQRKFMLWNILGAIGWGIEWLGAGYLFAQSLNLAHVWISRIGMAVLVILLVSIVFWLLKRWVIQHGQALITLGLSILRSVKTAIINNQDVQKLVKKHPRFFTFLQKRLDKSHFFGLPATLLGLSFLYVLMLFAGIVEDFVTSDAIVAVDHHVAQLLGVFHEPAINAFFYWVTELGIVQIVLPLLIIASMVLWLLRKPWLIVPLLVSSLGAFAFSMLGKLVFHRPRPEEALLFEQTYSFPSGHATQAVALYGFIFYLLIRHASQWKSRVNLFFLGFLIIVLIGLSRIVLGVHYLSDVWAGYLVGMLWLIIGISITEWLLAIGNLTPEYQAPKRSRILAVLLTAIFLLYYAFASVLYPPHWQSITTPATIQLKTNIVQQLSSQKIQYTQTFLGAAQQPLSVALLVDNERKLMSTLQQAGWKVADKPSLDKLLKLLKEGMAYDTAPIAPGFWNQRLNNLALEMPWRIDGKPMIITLLLWKTPYVLGDKHILLGVVRAYDRMQWGLLHHVYPDIDASREALLQSLQNTGALTASCEQDFTPITTRHYLLGGQFFTHGKLLLLDLSQNDKTDQALFCPTK